jgi:protein SCO1
MFNQPLRSINASLVALLVLAAAPALEARDEQLPSELVGVDVTPRIGEKVNLDLQFTAENGYQVPLRQLFGKGKPVILNLVYYRCPMLCNLVLNGQAAAMRELAWTAGKEFDIVTISIDPEETFDLAKGKKSFYLEAYGRPQARAGWHFLTDHQGNTKRLADQVGFKYHWDAKTEQWAHTAAIMVLTPDGRVSQYLYGVRFKERDLRLALTEASEGKLGTLADKLILFCFHYDPEAKGYVPFARNLMKAGGGLMVLVMGIAITVLFRRERKGALPTGVATAK